MEAVLTVLVILLVFIAVVLAASIRVVQEYERGVIFRLGRLVGARGPGLFFIIPVVERMRKVDLRIITMDVPGQEVITRDNVTVRVNAVAYFRVLDAEAAVVRVLDYIRATSQIAQTTLRSVLGQSDLDELLSQRDQINQRLQRIIDDQTEPWGIKVSVVEVKDVELPQSMQRAMARQAEAERDRRAKIINAEGEFQAAERLAQAGRIMAEQAATLQLRFLQTLSEVAAEKNSTIVLPVPVDLISAFMQGRGTAAMPGRPGAGPEAGEQPRPLRRRAGPAGGPPESGMGGAEPQTVRSREEEPHTDVIGRSDIETTAEEE